MLLPAHPLPGFGKGRALLTAVSLIFVLAPASWSQTRPLRCRPGSLHPGDTLVIVMPKGHGRELTINARGKAFPIQKVGATPPHLNAMTEEAFLKMDTLRIAVDTLARVPYVFGTDTSERVFSAPGTYLIQLGDNLYTEGDVLSYECRVRYSLTRRSSRTRPN